MSSKTFVIPPLVGCLWSAEEYIAKHGLLSNGRKVQWLGMTNDQRDCIERYVGDGQSTRLIDAMGDELKMIAHRDADVINQWLADNGYTISLSKRNTPTSLCVASIMDILVKWLFKGTVTTINGSFPAVKIKEAHGSYVIDGFGEPIGCIDTQGGDVVYMRMVDKEPRGPLDIANFLRDLPSDDEVCRNSEYGSVVFPMIDYNSHEDAEWIVGMRTGSDPDDWFIEEAVQQTKFRMNEFGARSQAAAAMMMTKGIVRERKSLVIDRPFILWIERKGFSGPIFAGYFDESSWKRPEGIEGA